MNTLDRYIARQYLFNVLALLVVLFSFVVAVDVSLNIDRFIEAADKMNPDGGAIRRATLVVTGVAKIWWPKLLQLSNYMIGLVLVAAMGFTFTQLARHRELVAVLASGISLHRVARPVLIVAACVMALRIVNSEFVLSHPSVAPLLTRDPSDIGKTSWAEFPVRLVADASNRVFLAEKFDPVKGEMDGVTIWEREPGGRAQKSIKAEKAKWDGKGWVLSGAKVVPLMLATRGSAGGGPEEPPPERIETDLGPETLKLKRYEAFSQTLNWWQISDLLKTARPEMRDKLQRIRWSRLSQVVCSLLVLIITMPFFLTREPKNMLVQSLKCAPVGIVALMGGILLSAVPWPGLPPGFGVFIPVFVLVPVAIASVTWMKT